MTSPHISQLIEHFGLERLPVEGVLFKQTYRATEMIEPDGLPTRYRGEKPYGTCVIALLTDDEDSLSSMHRLTTDEIWHFYMGDPIEMLLLHTDGSTEQRVLGHAIFEGQLLQTVVPRGAWMGARLVPGGAYALFGNTMAPGFTSPDFENGDRDALIAQYPSARDLITALTRPGEHARFMPDGY
jgi:uncharacterized protein